MQVVRYWGERTGGDGTVVKAYRRAIDSATRMRDFIDWRAAGGFAGGIDQVVDSIRELLGALRSRARGAAISRFGVKTFRLVRSMYRGVHLQQTFSAEQECTPSPAAISAGERAFFHRV